MLQADERQARHVADFEFDKDIDVAVWAEIVAQHRTEQGQPADVILPAERCDFLSVDRNARAWIEDTPKDLSFAKTLSGSRASGLPGVPLASMGTHPWQSPFAERLIGSVRRECVDHVVALGERHLQRILTAYFAYYHQARTRCRCPTGERIARLPTS